jgi:DNA repair exonuclease SbcCD ATPase subunit
VYAKNAQINIHKGYISGDEIHITRLEHGIVEANRVSISQVMGGKIIANEVVIEILASHANIQAAHKIEIKQLKGEENKLIIDPVVLRSTHVSLEGNEEQMQIEKNRIKEVEKEIEEYAARVQANKHSFNEIKKRLIQYKNSGVKMPSQFVVKYKQFQAMFTHLEALKEELKQKNERYDVLTQSHKSFQNDIFDARVINHGRWHGHNEVIFRLVEPKMELSFLPPNASKIPALGLVMDEEEEYYIKEVDL